MFGKDSWLNCPIRPARREGFATNHGGNNVLQSGMKVNLADFLSPKNKKYNEGAFFYGHQLKERGFLYEYVLSDSMQPDHPFSSSLMPGALDAGVMEELLEERSMLLVNISAGRYRDVNDNDIMMLLHRSMDIKIIQANERFFYQGLRYISEYNLYCICPITWS